MKKLLLLILFAVSLTAFAQVQIPQEYTIQKPLRLETVNVGSIADSILVRGVDKTIKYVPRSEFSGSGGSQNLQQTLDEGKTASYDDGNSVIELLAGSSGDRSIYMTTGPADQYNEISIERDRAYFTGHDVHGDDEINSYFLIQNGKIFITADGTTNGQSGTTRISIEEPISVSDLKFPAKPVDGSYTIATTEDIPIKIVDSLGSLSYDSFEGNITFNIQSDQGDSDGGINIVGGSAIISSDENGIVLRSNSTGSTRTEIVAPLVEGKEFTFVLPTDLDEGYYELATRSEIDTEPMTLTRVFNNSEDYGGGNKAAEGILKSADESVQVRFTSGIGNDGTNPIAFQIGWSGYSPTRFGGFNYNGSVASGQQDPRINSAYRNNSYTYETEFIIRTPVAETVLTQSVFNEFELPIKNDPTKVTYTLATTEDLQAMLDKNATVTGSQNLKLQSNDFLKSANISNNEISSISPAGKVYLRNGAISFSSGGKCIQLSQSPTQGVASQYFVTMPNFNGQLALRDEFSYNSPATTAYTGTALNSGFANAPNGFRVRTAIVDPVDATKFLVYEKTAGGWIEYSYKIVAP